MTFICWFVKVSYEFTKILAPTHFFERQSVSKNKSNIAIVNLVSASVEEIDIFKKAKKIYKKI